MGEDGGGDICVKNPTPGSLAPGNSDSDSSPMKDGSGRPTPTRRNKRKMAQPKKRSDFSIKRLCPESPGSLSDAEDGGELRDFSPTHGGKEGETEAALGLVYPRAIAMFPHPHGMGVTSIIPASGMPDHTPLTIRAGPSQEPPPRGDSPSDDSLQMSPKSPRKQRKNYKNMTRERRVDANARERSRVHTISAAFEALRRAVPSYSYNQRLSKLAILRIACSYILSLATLADLDYSKDQEKTPFADCVDMCTKTIQSEGRTKRRH